MLSGQISNNNAHFLGFQLLRRNLVFGIHLCPSDEDAYKLICLLTRCMPKEVINVIN